MRFFKKILILILVLQIPLVWADKYTYDRLSVGMNIYALQNLGYKDCQDEPDMGTGWVSCTNPKNFFPNFLGYSIDDVEVELPDGKTVSAINLITSTNISALALAKQVKGTITDKKNLSLISIKNHQDSLMIMNGKIAILNNVR